ncbi:MAG: hypothetical protein HQ483_01795 [Rhodospirillales bacterium]|nr:hypothetical protein [Rhodospirillales bacterium]
MTSRDKKLKQKINTYREKQYQRYLSWYAQNAKLAQNNLIAAFVVVVICTLALVLFPGPMDQMSFLQYSFDPTNAIRLGLAASILLALYSMFTSFRQRTRCLAIKSQLLAAFSQFHEGDKDDAGAVNEAAFHAFTARVDAIMAAANPEVVIAVELDNQKNDKSSQA